MQTKKWHFVRNDTRSPKEIRELFRKKPGRGKCGPRGISAGWKKKGNVQMRPRLVRSERIFWTAFFASSGFFPPVMISFPDPKRRTTTLGSSSR